jgi:hypothetical protein
MKVLLRSTLLAAVAVATMAFAARAAEADDSGLPALKLPEVAGAEAAAPGDAASAPDAALLPDAASPPEGALLPEAVTAPDDTAAQSPIRTIGELSNVLHVVDHGDSWSMHAENIATGELFRLWHEAGGPEVTAKVLVDRLYTLSVHRLEAEKIVERVLVGYGHTMHYDADGRLARVRIYSPQDAAAQFKTPRLTESLSDWRDEELAEEEQPAARRPRTQRAASRAKR